MNIATPCWRHSWRRCVSSRSAIQKPLHSSRFLSTQYPARQQALEQTSDNSAAVDLSSAPFKQYQRLDGKLQISRLTQDHDEHLCAQGIEGLYSPTGFQYAYTDWQTHVLSELNARTNDFIPSTGGSDTILNLIRNYAKRSDEGAAIFNYASMAFNNTFYFKGLKYGIPAADEGSDMSYAMRNIIERDFFSVTSLKAELLARAKAMFAPGFVWLVIENNRRTSHSNDRERRLALMSTYGAGSPLSAAHFRQQLGRHNIGFEPEGKASFYAQRVATDATLEVKPLLCVSTWQHSYIPDWEVSGKDRFLEAWWDRINWGVAEFYADIQSDAPSRRSSITADVNRERTLQRQTGNSAQSIAA